MPFFITLFNHFHASYSGMTEVTLFMQSWYYVSTEINITLCTLCCCT